MPYHQEFVRIPENSIIEKEERLQISASWDIFKSLSRDFGQILDVNIFLLKNNRLLYIMYINI